MWLVFKFFTSVLIQAQNFKACITEMWLLETIPRLSRTSPPVFRSYSNRIEYVVCQWNIWLAKSCCYDSTWLTSLLKLKRNWFLNEVEMIPRSKIIELHKNRWHLVSPPFSIAIGCCAWITVLSQGYSTFLFSVCSP